MILSQYVIKMSIMHSFIIFIISTVFVATVASSQQLINNSTIIDDDDPCLGQEQDVIFPHLPLKIYKSSFVESCFESLSINTTNVLQHIGALNQMFRDSYCFYNIAKDPPASDPRAHQAELGYTILQGPDEGQVDIDAELSSISESVKSDGATVATFWDVNSVFNRLRDAHVVLPQFRNDSLLADAALYYIPERCQNGTVLGRHEFSSDSGGELMLKMFWVYGNEIEEKESIVKSLNGMTVYSFFSGVANSPSLKLPYQSIGARFNALLQKYRQTYKGWTTAYNNTYGTGLYLSMFFILPLNSRPSNVYPDLIRVVYEDGDEELYQSGMRISSLEMAALRVNESSSDGLMTGLNRTAAQEVLNKAGRIYESYEDECIADQSNDVTPQLRSGANSSESASSSYFDAEQILLDPNDGGAMAAVKIGDGYAVLKLEVFEINTQTLVDGWKALSAQAKESGVNKLIIDISNNGGGEAVSAATLAQLMYPSVEYDVFRKSYDFVISKPMNVYNNTVLPIYNEIFNTIIALSDSDYQGFIDTLTEEQFTSINEALCSMQNICNDIECAGQNSCSKNCDNVNGLKSVMESFETYKSPPVLKNLALTLYNLIRQINPGRVRPTVDLSDVDLNGVRTVNRGGVLTNVSLPFTADPIEYYYQAVASSYQTLHTFDEYIIVSNGVSGSTTAIFASLVGQLWKNRNTSLVKSSLVSVSYGGLNTTEGDVMMAGFPASNQDVHLEDPLLAAGILHIFNTLLKGDSTFSPVISSALSEYANVLPEPPYFANTLPKLPVLNYYSTFMGKGALPLQYVKMPADEHIPFYYTQTTIEDSGDLPALYDKASKLFSPNIINSEDVSSSSGNEDSRNDIMDSNQSSSTLNAPWHSRAQTTIVLLMTAGYMFV